MLKVRTNVGTFWYGEYRSSNSQRETRPIQSSCFGMYFKDRLHKDYKQKGAKCKTFMKLPYRSKQSR